MHRSMFLWTRITGRACSLFVQKPVPVCTVDKVSWDGSPFPFERNLFTSPWSFTRRVLLLPWTETGSCYLVMRWSRSPFIEQNPFSQFFSRQLAFHGTCLASHFNRNRFVKIRVSQDGCCSDLKKLEFHGIGPASDLERTLFTYCKLMNVEFHEMGLARLCERKS